MNNLQKRTLQLAAGVAALAALVHVANTAAEPAIARHASKKASQPVMLMPPNGETLSTGQTLNLSLFVPGSGLEKTAYVVPGGQHLVLTTVDITTYYANAQASIYSVSGSKRQAIESFYLDNVGMQQYQFPSGILYPSGSIVGFGNVSKGPLSSISVTIHGYLAAN